MFLWNYSFWFLEHIKMLAICASHRQPISVNFQYCRFDWLEFVVTKCVYSPSDKDPTRTGLSAMSPTSQPAAAGNNMNFKRGIAYRTTISGSTVKDRKTNATPARTGTFTVPTSDANDVSSISHGSGAGGRGLSFFDKLTSKFSRR